VNEAGLRILYRILRLVALRRLNLSMPWFIGYSELSQQFAQQPGGYWVDPHRGWDEALAEIDRRCFGLFHDDFRPVLSVLVVHQDGDLRPGGGFWGIEMPDGREVTPAHRSEAAWVAMCTAVYAHHWPAELDDLPPV
jgi:hypothetical protein